MERSTEKNERHLNLTEEVKDMKRSLKVLCLVLSAALLLAGCGGNGAATQQGAVVTVGEGAEEGATATAEAATNIDRDDVIFCMLNEPKSLDPLEGENAQDWMVPRQINETLIRDAPGDPTAQEPLLASSWEFAEDGSALLLKIPKGVKFSNGYDLTAEDVAWSLNRAFSAPATKAYSSMVKDAAVIDEETVALNLLYPYEPIIKILTNPTLGIQSKQYYEECQANGTAFNRNPIGTGAYYLEEWVNGEKLVLQRNENYHGEPAPIQTVTVKIIADQTTAGIAMEKNEVDAFFGVATSDLARFRTDPNLQVLSARSFTFYSLWFNTTRAPFDDPAVRQAISYAINRQDIIDGGMNGVGWTIECPMPSGIFGYQEDFKHNAFDLEKAKQLLADAGYPDGFSCVLKCTPEDYVKMPAQVLQEQLRKLGIDCQMEVMERGAYLEDVQVNSNFDIIFAGSGALYADADSVTYKCLHSSAKGAGGNWSLYDNPQMDALLEEARTELDTARRDELYLQVSALCKEDCPIIPLCQSTNTLTAWKDLKGAYGHPATKYLFQDWYW